MRGFGPIALAILVAAVPAEAAPDIPGPVRQPPAPRFATVPLRAGPGVLRRRFPRRLFVPRLRSAPNVPPELLQPPPPDEFIQPEGPGPSPLLEGEPGDLPALAHGFHLSVLVGAGQGFAVPSTLGRFVEVGQALGACFQVPAGVAWGSITLRVSFRRDGSVFGLPRIPFSDAASAEQKSELARSLLEGLKRCTPLRFSPSLGAAVAGEIFAIRFIHQDKR